jgi:uroporphyrinogen-III decarboxylase
MASQSKKELVVNAIEFKYPDRVPVWHINRDQELGDILLFELNLTRDDGVTDEWGYAWENLSDGTMGQPKDPVISSLSQLKDYKYPRLNPERRSEGIEQIKQKADGHYLLGSLHISGFTKYTFIRGFSNAMEDIACQTPEAMKLLDRVFDLETEIIEFAAKIGLDGIHFADDWGTQRGLIISPQMWRDIFKPRYQKQFDHAHSLGMHVWFHCCGNIGSILSDFNEIGVDVMNIAQPNVVDISKAGQSLKGKQCFLMPISYQTVSITGTPDDIHKEAKRLYESLGTDKGGFIGYVEEYGCMGMSELNYQACISAFRELCPTLENIQSKI